MKAVIEAPEFVHKMFANWEIGDAGKQKVWQAFVEHMVGINTPIHLQADLENFTDSIEETGEIDEILGVNVHDQISAIFANLRKQIAAGDKTPDVFNKMDDYMVSIDMYDIYNEYLESPYPQDEFSQDDAERILDAINQFFDEEEI